MRERYWEWHLRAVRTSLPSSRDGETAVVDGKGEIARARRGVLHPRRALATSVEDGRDGKQTDEEDAPVQVCSACPIRWPTRV